MNARPRILLTVLLFVALGLLLAAGAAIAAPASSVIPQAATLATGPTTAEVTSTVAATTTSAATTTAPAGGDLCADLAKLPLPNTTLTQMETLPAGEHPDPIGKLPVAICRVVGVISPTFDSVIGFEVWLPANQQEWNGKFNGVGNGGLAGFINYDSMRAALAKGYATASTDGGHIGGPPVPLGDASWALNHPQKIIDFGYRAVHLTTQNAKDLVAAFYGAPPKYSYFTGCSGGGQQGLAEAQRYPQDYDGVVSGAPAAFPTHMWPGELYPATINQGTGGEKYILTEDKLPMISQAVLKACDALDGVNDGIITDPRLCHFDPSTLLCKEGQDASACLTQPQVDVVKKVYAGLIDPANGAQFWYGYEPSSEIGWWGHVGDPFFIPVGYFQDMVYNDPNWKWQTYPMAATSTFNDLHAADELYAPFLDAMNPNLSAFREQGGKLILWHGWIDQNISPRNSVAYYDSVNAAAGGQADQFLRLFMIPGMQHCVGGPGTDTFDALKSLEQWVEQGVAPASIPAAHMTDGKADLTRPLCPYPQVAVYKGTGDTKDAASFICR